MNNDLISIILTSYNHAPYLKTAIDSILNQTYKNLEVIIIDDGSTDSSVEIINSYDDSRIIFTQTKNIGPALAMSHGVSKASGKYMALMTSDDISDDRRIEEQYSCALENPNSAIFTLTKLIDKKGVEVKYTDLLSYQKSFHYCPGTQADSLKQLFYFGNFLCGPSLFLPLSLMKQVSYEGVYSHPMLYQLQDFDLWIRISKVTKIIVLPDLLFSYRVTGRNLSQLDPNTLRAIQTEQFLIFSKFFTNMSDELFYETFADQLGDLNPKYREAHECFVLINAPKKSQVLAGLKKAEEMILNGRLGMLETVGIDIKFLRKKMISTSIFTGHHYLDLTNYKFTHVFISLYKVTMQAFRRVIDFKRKNF